MRKLEVVLTLALLGSAAMSWWLWEELRDERKRNVEVRARATSLPTPIAAPDAALPVPTPTSASPASARRAADISATAALRAESTGREDAEASLRRMLQQPEYREAWRAQQRLNYARRRENVIRLLGFTAEEADAVVEIAIDRQLIWYERSQPNPVTAELAQQQLALFEQDQREDQEKFRVFLGEEKRARLQQYMESRSTRVQVDQMRPQFTGADTLRDDQVEPLIVALHVERARLHTEQQEFRTSVTSNEAQFEQSNELELELLKAAHERMHSAAAPILSSSQLKRFDVLLKRDLDRQDLEARLGNGAPDADSD